MQSESTYFTRRPAIQYVARHRKPEPAALPMRKSGPGKRLEDSFAIVAFITLVVAAPIPLCILGHRIFMELSTLSIDELFRLF